MSDALRYFEYKHLPDHLQDVSCHFYDLAARVMQLPENAQRDKALDKLLEAKDAAVRAALPEKKKVTTLAVEPTNEAAAAEALKEKTG